MFTVTRASKVLLAAVLGAFLAAPALAKNPYARADDTWISISGKVKSVSPDSFVLDYGEGTITVEMDDGDRDADAYKLLAGDQVTVNGVIDDDFFERTTIEASSVYVEKIGTYFFASARDEEDLFFPYATTFIVGGTVAQGKVIGVEDDEFTLRVGGRSLTVEVDEMPYNPLDEVGYQKIRIGDLVRVNGVMDDDLFEGRELVATSVITLAD